MPRAVTYGFTVIIALCLAAVVWRLAEAESARGVAYPPYSSHRADAEGLKALFDVADLTGRRVVRLYTPLQKDRIRNSLVVTLGMSPGTLVGAALDTSNSAAKIAANGNTVVLGVAGECMKATIREWQLAMQCVDKRSLFAGSGWTGLYGVQGASAASSAAMVERRFGSGSIVIIGDSRLLTNASLAQGSRGEVLTLLLERHPTVVFDEGNLGVTDAVTTGALIRRYRLHGVLLAILLLFVAFVWKSASSFLPLNDSATSDIMGRDTGVGLANLLRRTVPTGDVVGVALAEWAKGAKDERQVQDIKRIAAPYSNPVEAYNAVTNALHRKRNLD